jgi:EAL domain-containing protein (putative c-di-GMP-specific phosphodiesterase class I)
VLHTDPNQLLVYYQPKCSLSPRGRRRGAGALVRWQHIVSKDRDAAIVRSTIELAHSLGLVLVAEGVEDLESAELLRAMGCDVAQGYYFGRPQPGRPTLAETADADALNRLDRLIAL